VCINGTLIYKNNALKEGIIFNKVYITARRNSPAAVYEPL